jgi:hypothetical protein
VHTTAIPGSIQKALWVRRSDRSPILYWWSLPLSLRAFATLFGAGLSSARALVTPSSALQGCADEVAARPLTPDVTCVSDVRALLEACHAGRAKACTIAIFPATRSDADLESAAPEMRHDLEKLGFTLAIAPHGEGGMPYQFCFRVPGKVLEGIESLALDRRFGGNLGQVEMALLQGLALRPNQRMRLSLVMENGQASLRGVARGGRRRIYYLESGKGFVGQFEQMTLREAVAERLRSGWRRFPFSVVMFLGLPFFIGVFWLQSLFAHRDGAPGNAPRGEPNV